MSRVITSLLAFGLLASSLAACDPDDPPASHDAAPGAADAAPMAADGAPAPDAAPADGALPDADPAGAFTVDGVTSGASVPASGQIAVVWAVFTGSNDHLYFFGHGTQSGATFHLPLLESPPAEALNGGTGVGVVLLFGADAVLPPDGVYTGEPPPGLLGASARHAVIYRAPGAVSDPLPWATAFPAGYSCGQCVDGVNTFDTYAPIACAQVGVQAPSDLSTLDGCNFY